MDPKCVLILTHQKAGTHRLRFFLANYLSLLEHPRAEIVTYQRLQEMMPNAPMYLLTGARPYREPRRFPQFDISEIMHSHVADKVGLATDQFHLGKKVISWRNPLDFLVSIWHYNYRNRKDPQKKRRTINDVLEHEIRKYAAQVTYMRQLVRARAATSFKTTYESMMRDAEAVFTQLVDFLGLPSDRSTIAVAAERSSFKAVRKLEEGRGRAIVAPIKGFFTRSGKIGQWKAHLSDAQVEQVQTILAEYEIRLSEFVLE